ncbi:hypothetical protein [Streptomyces evansiae]|nr:hypothetical protein [Streptomyces sp. DSM 41859]MDT0421652.1 hypothetical protein [Streptomyces sp. DSM 41859]
MSHTAARPRRSGALAAASALSLGTLLLSACASPGTGGGRRAGRASPTLR